ncbi:hypothetical protein GEV33_001883 [Tenebrio molitor]|uniref:Integrase catalytic domain-containing protein n=1 Tax=Tenebrio molitor TaxID=7067 RepID=A0A8J6HWN6_TENMO|nr:hypothetical protein GEV33_001883 [Tenebrio molitor]
MSEICRPKFIVRHSTCVAASCGSSQPAAPQKPRQPKRPLEAIACDLMGPYPRTPSGNRFILVVTDLFSRWVEGFAIPTSTTSVIVRLLEEEVFTRQGYPGAIITDNGSQFTSRRWTRACRHWQTRTWTTAPYTPRENPTERRNQELKKALRFRLVGRGQNTQLLYGRDLAYPGAWDAPGDNEPLTPASERLIEAQRHQELYIQRRFRDEEAAVVTFQPEDLVMLRVPAVTPFRPFNCKWTGPHQAKLGRNTTSTDFVLRLHLFKIHHPTGGGYRTIIPPSGAQQQWLQAGAVTKYRSANSGSLGFPNRRDAQQTIPRAESARFDFHYSRRIA